MSLSISKVDKEGMHILLACYNFPPNPGIGGRRWAKMAKGLAHVGYTVHVIKADRPSYEVPDSNWLSDTQSAQIKVYSLPRLYPAVLTKPKLTVPEKVLYRLQRAALYAIANGTIYDQALFWKSQFMKKASLLIERYGIKNVIATGAPFRLLYYAAQLKAQYKHLCVICDYRDPWTDAANYGMAELNDKRKGHEVRMEKVVYSGATYITTPYDNMVECKRYGFDVTDKVKVIPHPYDPEDLHVIDAPLSKNVESGRIRITFAGELYRLIDAEASFKGLEQALIKLRQTNKDIYNTLSVDFFAPEYNVRRLFDSSLDEVIRMRGHASRKDVHKELRQSDFCLAFLSHHNRHFMTTKFFEIIAMRKPIILIGPRGDVASFIEQHGLGVALEPEHVCDSLQHLLIRYFRGKMPYNQGFNVEQFSLPRVTEKLRLLFH